MILSLRKADFLLFFIFVAAAALIAAAPLLTSVSTGNSSAENRQMVRITCMGEEIGIYPLEENTDIEISRSGHRNLVSIQDHTVHMDYSDCKNQVCVDTGKISRIGETIVCLPNRVVVEIISSAKGGETDDDIDAIVK